MDNRLKSWRLGDCVCGEPNLFSCVLDDSPGLVATFAPWHCMHGSLAICVVKHPTVVTWRKVIFDSDSNNECTLKHHDSLPIHVINQTSHRSLEEELGLEENSICTKKKTNEKEKRKSKWEKEHKKQNKVKKICKEELVLS